MQFFEQRYQRRTQNIRGAEQLERNTAQFFEDRRGAVGVVVLLIADVGGHDQPTLGQALQLALHGARSGAREGNQFSGEKTALRLAEQQAQHPLLGDGEQCAGQGRALASRRRPPGRPGGFFRRRDRFHTHIGYEARRMRIESCGAKAGYRRMTTQQPAALYPLRRALHQPPRLRCRRFAKRDISHHGSNGRTSTGSGR